MATARTDESGFGLIELLLAMTILSVGLLALVGAFSSGTQAVQRASTISTATAVADAQMEAYRAITYDAIALSSSSVATATSSAPGYSTDPARQGAAAMQTTGACTSPIADTCTASRVVTGPDGKGYRVDTYIFLSTPTAASRNLKAVTIVVRSSTAPYTIYVRAQSTFDCSTGQTADPNGPEQAC